MKRLILAGAALAALTTSAHAASPLDEFAHLPQAQQSIAMEAMTHWAIAFKWPDGSSVTDPKSPAGKILVPAVRACDYEVLDGLRSGAITTAQAAAVSKTDCLWREVRKDQSGALATINAALYHH